MKQSISDPDMLPSESRNKKILPSQLAPLIVPLGCTVGSMEVMLSTMFIGTPVLNGLTVDPPCQ